MVGHYTLLRLWPEYILAGLVVWAVALWAREHSAVEPLLSSRLVRIIAAYVGLNIVAATIAHVTGGVSTKALLYGLLLNVRFLVWFIVVWLAASRSDWLQNSWQKLIVPPLLVVAIFALLQFFVLPADFLAHFGYNAQTTIPPAQTINQDTPTIRAQSFLRGPNPLGAYLMLGIGLLAIATMRFWRKAAAIILSTFALFVTFSRSAWVGLLGMGSALILLQFNRKQLKLIAAVVLVAACFLAGAMFAQRHNDGLQNALFHVNDDSTAATTSNSGHVSAMTQSFNEIVREPFGRGPGSAGPASVYNQLGTPRNSENYVLSVGQELGWVGIGLFLWIIGEAAYMLYVRKAEHLHRGLLATLIGLCIVSLFSYVWVDPTIAYLWWGLAGIALGSSHQNKGKRTSG